MDLGLHLCFALVSRVVPDTFLNLLETQFPQVLNKDKKNCLPSKVLKVR